MTDRVECGAGGCERTALLRALHDRDHTIEHLVQANHALHDELAAARARIAALENQLDELGEGAYRAAAERDNHYVPQLHEWKARAERAEAEVERMRPVVDAAREWRRADRALDAAEHAEEYTERRTAEAVAEYARADLIAAIDAYNAAREEAHHDA